MAITQTELDNSTLLEVPLTGAQMSSAIQKAHSIQSSVDEIDNSVNNINTELLIYEDESVLKYNDGYRINSDGTLMADGNWQTSDYIAINKETNLIGHGYSTSREVIALYDDNYDFIIAYFGDVNTTSNFYSKTLTVTPSEASYARVVSNTSEALVSSSSKIATTSEAVNVLKKENYTTDAIFFQVQVNQDFDDIDSTTASEQDSETFLPVDCALMLPSTYQGLGTPTKIACTMHGAGSLVTDSSAGEMDNFTELLQSGYAIFDVNGSNNNYTTHADHMGSPRAISAYKKAFDYIQENYNVEHQIYLHGHSMGGLSALNFANHFSNIIKCVALFFPVTDLYNQAWLNPWYGDGVTQASIAREFNFDDNTGSTYEADKVIGYNPINNNSVVIDETRSILFNCPIKIWHGDSDTVVSLSGSQLLATAMQNAGVNCKLRVVTGLGHVHTDNTIKQEQLMFFNRY